MWFFDVGSASRFVADLLPCHGDWNPCLDDSVRSGTIAELQARWAFGACVGSRSWPAGPGYLNEWPVGPKRMGHGPTAQRAGLPCRKNEPDCRAARMARWAEAL